MYILCTLYTIYILVHKDCIYYTHSYIKPLYIKYTLVHKNFNANTHKMYLCMYNAFIHKTLVYNVYKYSCINIHYTHSWCIKTL